MTEIPDKLQRVSVSNKEDSLEVYYEIDKNKITSDYTYYVDYLNGVITFDSSQNNKTFICTYYGISIPYMPASRIWTREENNGVIETLKNIVDTSVTKFIYSVDDPVDDDGNPNGTVWFKYIP